MNITATVQAGAPAFPETDPIFTITEVENMGRYAVARPVKPGEVELLWCGTTTDQVDFTVVIEGIKTLAPRDWGAVNQLTVTMPMAPLPKGTRNREEKERAAMLLLVGCNKGEKIPAGASLDALNRAIARRVENFNEEFIDKARRMTATAGTIWTDDTFAAERAKIAALNEARKAITDLLAAARDDLHAKGRDMLMGFFEEKQLQNILPMDELRQAPRERLGGLFGEAV